MKKMMRHSLMSSIMIMKESTRYQIAKRKYAPKEINAFILNIQSIQVRWIEIITNKSSLNSRAVHYESNPIIPQLTSKYLPLSYWGVICIPWLWKRVINCKTHCKFRCFILKIRLHHLNLQDTRRNISKIFKRKTYMRPKNQTQNL